MRSPGTLVRVIAAAALVALGGCNLLTGAADLRTDLCETCGEVGSGNDGGGSESSTLDRVGGDGSMEDGGIEGPGGALDPAFGSGGTVDLDALLTPLGVGARNDGRILVVGESGNQLAALALQPSGALDTTFGTGGRVIRQQGEQSSGRAIAFDSMGRAVVVGQTVVLVSTLGTSYPHAVRFGNTGVDTDFATNGGWRGNNGGEYANGVVLSPSDGAMLTVTGGSDHRIIGLTSNGSLDQAFGSNGIGQVQDVGGAAVGVVRAPDGYVTGGLGNLIVGRSLAAARLTLAGAPVPTYGTSGKAYVDISDDNETATALARQADGAVLLAGDYDARIAPATRRVAAVGRIGPTGAADTAYGTAGKAVIDLTEPLVSREAETRIIAMFVDSKGRALVVGSMTDKPSAPGMNERSRVWVARLGADGAFDPLFGTQGKVFLNPATLRITPTGAALQADGKLVVVGRNIGNGNRVWLARIVTSTTL